MRTTGGSRGSDLLRVSVVVATHRSDASALLGDQRRAVHLRLRAADPFFFLKRFVEFGTGAARRSFVFRFGEGSMRVATFPFGRRARAKMVLLGALRLTPRAARGRPCGRSAPLGGAVRVVML